MTLMDADSSPSSAVAELGLAILYQLPTPVLVISSHLVITIANQAAEEMFLNSPKDAQSSSTHALSTIVGCHVSQLAMSRPAAPPGESTPWEIILKRPGAEPAQALPPSNDFLDEQGVKSVHSDHQILLKTDSKERYHHTAEFFKQDLDIVLTTEDNNLVKNTHRWKLSALPVFSSRREYLALYFTDRRVSNIENVEPTPFQREIKVDSPMAPITTGPSVLESVQYSKEVGITPEQLSKIEQMGAAVFDSVSTLAFLLSADESTVVFNKLSKDHLGPEAVKYIGFDGEKLISSFPLWNTEFTERVPFTNCPALQCIRDRKPAKGVLGYLDITTGAKMITTLDAEPLYDPMNGHFRGVLCRMKPAQEAEFYHTQKKQEQIESHETICDVMPHMVWRSDLNGTPDYFSKRWYEFTGLSQEETMDLGFCNALHPDDLPALLAKWETGRLNGLECEIEARYRRHDGVYRWMLARSIPLFDEEGNILAYYGTTTDIHDLVMSRIKDCRIKDQMLTVLAHAEVSLFAVNLNEEITMAEGAMQANMINHRGDSVKAPIIGQTLDELWKYSKPQDQSIQLRRRIHDILEGKVKMSVAEHVVNDRTYRTRLVADLTENGLDGAQQPTINGVLGLSLDISDMQARAILEIENARLQMEEKSAQEASRQKSRFLANMSHEMRTPLSGVIGLAELLADTPLNDDQLEYVSNIMLSSQSLLTIVNDVLDFSKVESGRLDIEEVPFFLSKSIQELYCLSLPSAKQKSIALKFEGTIPDELEVYGDPGRIRQILLNLLTNAIKFTKEGSVTLSVRITPLGGSGVEVKFTVTDTGIGIEKEVLGKLFQPFCQGDSSTARLYGGTGLGLAISKNLAVLMNGCLELQSVPSVGSTVTFTVPLRLPPPPNVYKPLQKGLLETEGGSRVGGSRVSGAVVDAIAVLDIESPHLSTFDGRFPPSRPSITIPTAVQVPYCSSGKDKGDICVLLVEDNPINQIIALKVMKKLGFPTTAVWNGLEALDYLRCCLPQEEKSTSLPETEHRLPSIILMDVQMPILDGYSATRAIRTQAPFSESVALQRIPIIAMTASAIQGDREKCIEAGMNDYLAKPVPGRVLEQMLCKWGAG